MSAQLEIRRIFNVEKPAYAVRLSADGQYLAIGTERGFLLFNRVGERLLTYPNWEQALPIRRLALSPELQQVYLGTRQGVVIALDLSRENDKKEFRFTPRAIYECPNDLFDLVFEPQANVLAIGHLGPALSLISTEGRIIRRWHPDDGTATSGRTWSVSLEPDGDVLYAGSANEGTNRLTTLTVSPPIALRKNILFPPGQRITKLTALRKNEGVAAAIVEDIYSTALQVYDGDLRERWSIALDEYPTALVCDRLHPYLVCATGYLGRIQIFDVSNGKSLCNEVTVNSMVNDLSIVQGRWISAVTEDGTVYLMEFLTGEVSL